MFNYFLNYHACITYVPRKYRLLLRKATPTEDYTMRGIIKRSFSVDLKLP